VGRIEIIAAAALAAAGVVFLVPGGIAGAGKRFAGLRKLDAEESMAVRPGGEAA